MTTGWNSLAAECLYASMDDGVPENELSFYEDRIRKNGGIALDQACGTGRHIFPLLAKGLEVHGADISIDALKFANKAAGLKGLHPTLFHQRMEECDLPSRYGTIYIANGTFEIIVDRLHAIHTLEKFLTHLSPQGQLLIELSIPPEVTQGPSIHNEQHPIKWEPIQRHWSNGEIITTLWTEAFDSFEQTLVSKRRLELYIDGKLIRSEVHAHPMRWYYNYEFVLMLERAGYSDINTYSDYTNEPATKESKTVVYSARR
jgi:SAM-dependent methyltransferase